MSSIQDEKATQSLDHVENDEWMYSLEYVLRGRGPERVSQLLGLLVGRAAEKGIRLPYSVNTPYINTIPKDRQPRFPGNREIERRIKSIVRWNAMAMVVRANREESGLGGHISTFASAATLYEVGFNHFFRGPSDPSGGDQIYFQGHAAPGIYARAFLEGRITLEQLKNFRRELQPAGGLSSYPHPWLMPDFWQFATVSMGLGPLFAIYQARFNRYLEDRGLRTSTGRVWAFMGDGEMDEPEALGAISLASREKLDNLTFVINCNLQRLDGPVRGNGKIIQELETVFRGAGWNVVKVLWGDGWERLLERDSEGLLLRRLEEAVDGEYQKYSTESGAYIREHLFGTDPRLIKLVENLSDDDLRKLRRGGHDPEKVYAAYHAALEHQGSPTVILAKTIKGYGLGEAGEGRNVTHQQKKLNEQELREFRSRFGIPISDEDIDEVPFYRPPEDSPEMRYLREQRLALGGYVPSRRSKTPGLPPLEASYFDEFMRSSGDRPVATTMAFVRILARLMKEPAYGPRVVPIVPDEARTFGMDALFRQFGIYSHVGQRYEPVDKDTLLYYKEDRRGQILEEGITEAGAMASFVAAGTSYATHGVTTLPFFIFYSMFGFQRIGDQIWAACDMRTKGFLVGATAGRTTLAGEGLQHQDGHSHLLAYAPPSLLAYDPAFGYELAVIIREGLRRMFVQGEDVLYYLTVGNEPYLMPALLEGCEEGILQGIYRLSTSSRFDPTSRPHVQLLGSGAILPEVLLAQKELEATYGVSADVYSVTSYQQLYRNGLEADRLNRLQPFAPPQVPFISRVLSERPGLVVAASDYTRVLPHSVRSWVPSDMICLGTDGFGRSDTRRSLRRFFEVDAAAVVHATLASLAREGRVPREAVEAAAIKGKMTLEGPAPWRR